MTLHECERPSGDHPAGLDTLTLSEAYELAVQDKTSWCIVPLGLDLTIARLVLDDELRVVRIRDNSGMLLRFASIQEARNFLRSALGIMRTTVLPA